MEQGFMVSDKPTLFERLEEQSSDPLLALIALCDADPRPGKIDVGVGVYRDAAGGTPILRCVKAAERILLETQETKSYLGSQGDVRLLRDETVRLGGQLRTDQDGHHRLDPGFLRATRRRGRLFRQPPPVDVHQEARSVQASVAGQV